MGHPAQSRSHALIHRPKSPALMLSAALAVLALVLPAGCGASDPEQDSGNSSDSDSAAADSSAEAAAGTCSSPAGSQPAAEDVEVPPQTPQATGEVEAGIATSAGDLAVALAAEGAESRAAEGAESGAGDGAESGAGDGALKEKVTIESVTVAE